MTGGQILSDNTIGINLNGRKNGEYYTPILAWDDTNYAYVGLKADLSTGKIVSCSREEADDFYFAIVQDIPADDVLHTVPTVDHTDYGITVKLVDFGGKQGKYNGSASETTEVQQNVMGNSYWSNATDGFATPDLVTTDLKDNGYPDATITNKSLSELFGDAVPVNNLFISSTYHSSGYFEYDSTQNFAHLNNDKTFTVYQEIGSFNKRGAVYQHGQFMPFNDIAAGKFSGNLNTTTSTNDQLSSTDPRKYEQLYQIDNPDYYFGMEIEASFTQTEKGQDDWGHDIIYEFTGDDDFWLYVDGELIIDLGGLHKALSGSVNYSTGVIKYVDGEGKICETTLRKQFEKNYRKRHQDAADEDVNAFLAQYFEKGKDIFKDYTTHKMKIFYMERGAGASNLHMRFNLASVKPGTVELSKELTGVTEQKAVLAEYPYQIFYKPKNGSEEVQLKNSAHNPDQIYDYVFYKGTENPVTYRQNVTTGGVKYDHVFLLKAGQTAEINFPEEIESYRIVECGIDSTIYDSVKVNGEDAIVTGASEDAATIKNYGTKPESPDNRAQVKYTNHVSPDALRTINITKRLYREDGETELSYSEDSSTFNFRLYLATEFEQSLDESPADMHIYYVKDASGNYCTWDAENGKFASTEISSLEGITDEQLRSLIFHTSMNGSISKIPAGYTVEVRDVLVGTRFKVVERENEMPDGYAFLKYKYSNSISDPTDYPSHEKPAAASTGVTDKVIPDNDPRVDVCNIRGFGLRVNKVWSDKDYMTERDPIYFALYTRGDNDTLTLVPNSGRKMAYGSDSLYWYYLQLPVVGVAFNYYEIREVSVINNPVISEGGVLEDTSITGIIADNSVIHLNGTQKGESQSGSFPYTVTYEKGTPTSDTHVRVDTVTKSRPGVEIRKTDWAGKPLEGAEFTLKEGTDNLIGTFTSDKNGLVTVAFLSDNKTYTLTETKAPKNYHGLEKPLNIRVSGTEVTVNTDGDKSYYNIQPGTGGSMPALIIKNRSYSFTAKKLTIMGIL